MFAAKTAKEAMSRTLITLREDMDILAAAHLLVDKRLSGAPVVDRLGNLVGMLTERDCLRIALDARYYSESGGRVAAFMTAEVRAVDAATPTMEIAELFVNSHFRRFPVLEDGLLIGMISRRDVLRALGDAW